MSASEVTIVVGVFVVVQPVSFVARFVHGTLTDKTIYRWHETFVGRPPMSLGLKLCVSSEVGGFQHSAWPLLALALKSSRLELGGPFLPSFAREKKYSCLVGPPFLTVKHFSRSRRAMVITIECPLMGWVW